MKMKQIVENTLCLDCNNTEQFSEIIISKFKNDGEPMRMSLLLWPTKEKTLEGLITIGYECCVPEYEKEVNFKGKSINEICNWITTLKKQYHTKDSVLNLLKQHKK